MISKTYKILVLGNTGLLGSMVFDYLSKNPKFKIVGTYNKEAISRFYNKEVREYHFNASNNINEQLKNIFDKEKPDYIINCIGIIKPHCAGNDGVKSAIRINALFPHLLSQFVFEYDHNIRIIQIATDCVYDGVKGKYDEQDLHNATDVYGKTKSLGEVNNSIFLNIRTSIIGPEIKSKLSLLEWFLSQENNTTILGFNHHLWNGVTTLQFAQLCENIIITGLFDRYIKTTNPFHYVINETVTKFELLEIFNRVFNKKVIVKKSNTHGPSIKRDLTSLYFKNKLNPMENAIKQLNEYIKKSELFNLKVND